MTSKLTLTTMFLFTFLTSHSQSDNWKEQHKNEVTVKSHISTTTINEEEKYLVQYTANKKSNVPLEKLKKFLLNFDNHKNILENTETAKVVDENNDNEWLVFYEFDAPWPLPNFDCVKAYQLFEYDAGFELKGVSSFDQYEEGRYQRMQRFDMTYKVEKKK